MRATRKEGPDAPRRLRLQRPLVGMATALLAIVIGYGGMLMLSTLARAQQTNGAQAVKEAADPLPRRMTAEDFSRMLPATDMGAGKLRPEDVRVHGFGDGPATPFDAAAVAHNPLAPGAVPIGADSCAACHAREELHASHSLHVQAFRASSTGIGPQAACESCHGPGSAHAKNPDAPALIISFTQGSATPVATQAQTCIGCHAGGARQRWIGSVHQLRGVACTDCHNPMVRLSAEGLLANVSINEVCSTCHRPVRSQFNRRSHMPLPEGHLSCADCHNPHGGITEPLLKTSTVNETCYACHAEKRGPHLFEHAPVRESCLNCHTPHGSNHENLLVLPVPMLCQQCHTNTQHRNDLLTRQNLRTGLAPDERAMQRGCVNCHSNIHGSNHPSGPTFVQ